MKKLKLTWNCDGMRTAKLEKEDKLIFDLEFTHGESVGICSGNFPGGIKKDQINNSIIGDTYENSEFEKKREESVLRTPISEDFLWTRIWERNINDEEFIKLKEQLNFV
jgi:hypothetical protein